MHKEFYSLKVFFISLLILTGIGNAVTGQTVDLEQENASTGSIGRTARTGELIHYAIYIQNNTSSNITNSTVYGAIPAGTSYVPGTTKVNGVVVSDVNGQMPFSKGGLVNSASSGAGIIAPDGRVQIDYRVQINANVDSFTNTATLQATNTAGALIVVNANALGTTIDQDSWCNQIFQVTSIVSNQGGAFPYTYRMIKFLNPANGTAGTTFFSGTAGPCRDAITGATLSSGSLLTDVEAMALAPLSSGGSRIYFVNDPAMSPGLDLCYIDYSTGTAIAKRYTGYPLETNTGTGYNINRMTAGSDGYCYALTANAQDLIQFSADRTTNMPIINRLGALINDPGNGANNVLAETGGDMFGDANGRLYLVPASGKVYRINPATRIATYIGTITGLPATGTNSVAVDQNGYIYIGGEYQTIYRADLTNMTAVPINSGTSNVWKNGDFTSCVMPIFSPALNVTKSYTNLTGGSPVMPGDIIEYTITITNTGNINAGGVLLSDPIPAYAHYIANSTTVNGVAVADVNATMPYATSQLVNSTGAPAGIIRPGDANTLVIKFRVTTDKFRTVCNQATVNFAGSDVSPVIYSDDPSKPGGSDATCFWSDGALCENCCDGCSTLVNNAAVGRIITATVQPNPFRETINLQVQSNSTQQVSIRLIDFYGRTVYTATQQLGAGYNSFHVETPSSLARGVYVLELLAGNNRLVQKKLIKQ